MVRLKINSKLPVDNLKNLENKLLLFQSHIIMFTDVRVEIEKVKYGRKKNKLKNVSYLACKLHVYDSLINSPDEVNDESYVKTILTLFDINQMRKDYLTHVKELKVMQELEDHYNEPSYMDNVLAFLKENKLLSATKEYKQATDKSLQESKNDVLEIFEKHYPEQYKNFLS